MERRRFIAALTGGLLAAPLPVEAQQAGKRYRVGFLGQSSPPSPGSKLRLGVFTKALQDLGYIQGRNLVLEFRWAEGQAAASPGLRPLPSRPRRD